MKRLLELDNTVQLQMEKIAVFDLFAAAVKTCQPVAKNHDIKLIVAETAAKIMGDFDLLHDVLCNLIDNAIKASRESQTIELYTRDNVIVVSDS
ncbi:MAG: HAMP domain-containing histidine kinase, partial [Oscillospiraceae bacterium]|nr:HAMP domain-containing histidine kinase [Oscillospiraceae bacterium]